MEGFSFFIMGFLFVIVEYRYFLNFILLRIFILVIGKRVKEIRGINIIFILDFFKNVFGELGFNYIIVVV